MPVRPSSCQTQPLEQLDAETQAPDRRSKEVDAIVVTEAEDDILTELAELVEAEQLHQLRSQLPILPHISHDLTFQHRLSKAITSPLKCRIVGSTAGNGDLLEHVFTLLAFEEAGRNNSSQLVATALSWSPTGVSIAVTFGVQNSLPFCAAPGSLALWNLTSEKFHATRPHVNINTDCALQSLAYHPLVPSYIAAGTANGGIHVWDVSLDREDLEVGRSVSTVQDVTHARSVQAVSWVFSSDDGARYAEHAKAFLICSVSR